jgi:ribonuclease R
MSKIQYRKEIVSLLEGNKKGLSLADVQKQLKISKKLRHNFLRTFDQLLNSGQIIQIRNEDIFKIPARSRVIRGILNLTRAGFGFVHDEEYDVDIYIGRDHLNTAFDGDEVEVKLYATNRGKNQEGFVSQLLKRSRQQYVGTFHQTKYYGYVVPDNPKIYRDFYIPQQKQNNARQGQKVVVRLEKWENDHLNPEGSIVEIIGQTGEPGVDVASVVYAFQLALRFPEPVEKQAAAIPSGVTEAEIKNRLDLREKFCLTIDPEDAKDFDDAISLEKNERGNYLLGVHIADVSHYVQEQSLIDKEALSRGTSVYLVDRVIPMLPEVLSNQLCSLQPRQDRLTYSCIMEVNPEGEVIHYDLQPSVINSKHRFTYEQVQALLDANGSDPRTESLKEMMTVSKALNSKRFRDGGVDFETPEVTFTLDGKGFPTAIKRKQRLDSHRLIEEFMLLANKTVAEHILKISSGEFTLPFLYRVHEQPDEEKIGKFFEFLNTLGFKFKPRKHVTSKYFGQLLASIKDTKEAIVIEEVALRSMMRAIYSTKNIGHFGLGFKYYTHFTSPIRRYPDLMVHRLLKRYSQSITSMDFTTLSRSLDTIGQQSTAMERIAMEAERESVRLKKNEFISQFIDEEFNGIISGVMPFGIFVELFDTLVEGLVHVKDMNNYYLYDEKSYSLLSKNSNQRLRLGDSVRIKVKEVNLEEGKVDFLFVKKLESSDV